MEIKEKGLRVELLFDRYLDGSPKIKITGDYEFELSSSIKEFVRITKYRLPLEDDIIILRDYQIGSRLIPHLFSSGLLKKKEVVKHTDSLYFVICKLTEKYHAGTTKRK